ncbi:CMRF35-like molecule 6 [Pteronotus mesoamericanus]|uniref:CMRF35-like molecule 6 n=1 Tax=Pteronotus mesoamericanus TaxID=1884717 RepID=UPI0023EB85FC|nr:CMRF35-like molecule 6 [Pteronotus parnellii mesoamericanus]
MAWWDWATWLPSTLFLLQAPGCLSLSGPRHVTGTVGGTLSVQCRYQEEFAENKKYWCRNPCFILRRGKIVETTEAEREVRRGRVSIRDDPANLTFTVTLKNLKKDDADTYWCGIDTSVFQTLCGPHLRGCAPAPTQKISTSTLGPPFSLPVTALPSTARPETPDPRQRPRSLLSSVHFLLLVFLKLPLFLSMLGAVLWVNRPQRGSGAGGPPHSEDQ